jgi:hypothetical protein
MMKRTTRLLLPTWREILPAPMNDLPGPCRFDPAIPLHILHDKQARVPDSLCGACHRSFVNVAVDKCAGCHRSMRPRSHETLRVGDIVHRQLRR